MHLTGKFFHVGGMEYWNSGEVIDEDEQGFILVRIDTPHNAPARSFVFAPEDYVTTLLDSGELVCNWAFFNSREELKGFIDWLDIPPPGTGEQNVVQLPVKK